MTPSVAATLDSADLSTQGELILEALRALPTLTTQGTTYLSLAAALDATAGVLYPEGIGTEAEAARAECIARHGCSRLGFGHETMLGPPQVAFRDRGTYLRTLRQPTLDDVTPILTQLASSTASAGPRPLRLVPRRWVLHRLGSALWGLPLAQVETLQPELHTLGTQVDTLLSAEGWTASDAPPVGYWPAYYGTAYMQAMTPDLAALREALAASLQRGVRQWSTLRVSGLRAAFGYDVTEDPDGLIPEATWQALLDELGYTYEPGAWEVKAKPLDLPPDAASTAPLNTGRCSTRVRCSRQRAARWGWPRCPGSRKPTCWRRVCWAVSSCGAASRVAPTGCRPTT